MTIKANNSVDQRDVTLAGALNAALSEAMESRSNLVIMGEDIGKLGGVFRITSGLQERFGVDRVIDMPLSETGIVGMATGMALNGMSVIVEIQFDGFIYMCFNQIVSHLSRIFQKFNDRVEVVIRVPYGGGIKAVPHHEESPEALFLNIPHLEVLVVSDPCEASPAIRYALSIGRPSIIFESKKNYWKKEPVDGSYLSVIRPRLIMSGCDYTIITYGAISDPLVETISFLNSYYSLSCDMFKLVDLSYSDKEQIYRSVEKTGRVIIVHESYRFMGYGAELASELYEKYYTVLKKPILRIGSFRMPYPVTLSFKDFIPSKERLTVEISSFLKTLDKKS